MQPPRTLDGMREVVADRSLGKVHRNLVHARAAQRDDAGGTAAAAAAAAEPRVL